MVSEITRLFENGKPASILQQANKIYALIIGIEGAARSMHNIFTSYVFFKSFERIKKTYDKAVPLIELMKEYLSFVIHYQNQWKQK